LLCGKVMLEASKRQCFLGLFCSNFVAKWKLVPFKEVIALTAYHVVYSYHMATAMHLLRLGAGARASRLLLLHADVYNHRRPRLRKPHSLTNL